MFKKNRSKAISIVERMTEGILVFQVILLGLCLLKMKICTMYIWDSNELCALLLFHHCLQYTIQHKKRGSQTIMSAAADPNTGFPPI